MMKFNSAILMACLYLTGCGQQGEGGFDTKPTQTPVDQFIKQKEASGEYPVLDRTDTLAGIDADKNGIRDDIDLYISKQGYSEPQRNVAIQTAKTFQKYLLIDLNNEKAVHDVHEQMNRANACLFNFKVSRQNNIDSYKILTDLESLTNNTRKRMKSYLTINQKFDGTSFSSDDYKDSCEK